MKIIYVTAHLPFGHTEAFAISEINELVRKGHEVLLAPRQIPGEITHGDAAQLLPLTRAEPLISGSIIRGMGAALTHTPRRSLRTAVKVLRGRKLTTPLKNASVIPKGLWLAHVARAWGADHIHAYWASTPATVALIAGEATGIPWSFTAHRWDIEENNLLNEKVSSSSFTRFISQDGLDDAYALGIEQLDSKGSVIRMGVELEEVATSRRETARPYIICPASLIPRKGLKYLIEAASRLKDRGLVFKIGVAGRGEQRAELEALIAQKGLGEHVELLGQVAHEKLIEKYRTGEVDIIVMPSLHEGISVAIIEAMSYGVPAVTTSVGGMPELLADGRGLLVPAKEPEPLADALERLLRNAELRKTTGQKGKAHVFKEYAIETTIARMVAHFEAASLQDAKGVGTL